MKKTGTAAIIEQQKLSQRLRNNLSIYTVE